MDNHDKLAALVQKDMLRLTFMLGTPRSGSTISAKGFGQLHDVALDEPFMMAVRKHHLGLPSFGFGSPQLYEESCGAILAEVMPLIGHKTPVTLLVKEVAGVMSAAIFERWMELPSSVIVTIRSPDAQFVSYAKAYYIRERGGEKGISNEAFANFFLPRMEDIPLRNGMMMADVNARRWHSLESELEAVYACVDRDVGQRPTVALTETTVLRAYPNTVETNLLARLGMSVDGLAKLQSPWTKDFGGFREDPDAFKARSAGSRGLQPLSFAEQIKDAWLPLFARDHIAAMTPIYRRLVNGEDNVFMPTIHTVLTTACAGTDCSLLEMDPVVARTMLEATDNRATSRLRQSRREPHPT